MKCFDVTEGATVTFSVKVMDGGRIQLVRESPTGTVIYFDSPEDAIRRWNAWVLRAAGTGDKRSEKTATI
jgi:hypothetical protein